MSGPICAHSDCATSSHQRRGQNDLSTEVVVFSNCVVTWLSLLDFDTRCWGSTVTSFDNFLPFALFSVWFTCDCFALLLSGLPCAMSFDPKDILDWHYILSGILCRLLFWLLSGDIMRWNDPSCEYFICPMNVQFLPIIIHLFLFLPNYARWSIRSICRFLSLK